MSKDKTPQSLTDFSFDDDSVFSQFETPTKLNGNSSSVTTLPKGFDLPEEDDPDEKPTKLEKTAEGKEKKEKPVVTGSKEEEVDDTFEGFGETPSKPAPKSKEEPPPVVKKQEQPPEKKKEDKEEEEGEEEDEKEEENEDDDDDVSLDEDFYTNLALDLKDEGVFQEVELPKDKKLTREEFIELQDTEVESRFNDAIESFVEDMDEDGKEFVKYKKNGGSTATFFNYLQNRFVTIDGPFDEDNPKHVSKIIDHYLRKVENLEGEDLEDRKEWLKKGGKEITYAKNYYSKMEKAEAASKKAIHEQLVQDQKDVEDRARAFDQSMRQLVKEVKKVGSFSFNETDRKALVDYINKPIIKTGKNKFVPKMHIDLNRALTAKTPEDRLRLLALAKVLASDFVLTDLEQTVETKVTKQAKERINKNTPRITSGKPSKARELADLFD